MMFCWAFARRGYGGARWRLESSNAIPDASSSRPEVRSSEHRVTFATLFVEVGQNANHVARFLRVGGNQHLFFEQAQKMRGKRPGNREFALAPYQRSLSPSTAKILGHVRFNERISAVGNLQTVEEQTVQHPAAILLYPLGITPALKSMATD